MTKKDILVRNLIAKLIYYSGCGCCGDREEADKIKEELGKLFKVPLYSDGSGRNWGAI